MRAVIFVLGLMWAGTAQARDLSDVSWIRGCWRLQDPRGEVTEVWSAPPLPALFGYNVTRRNGSTEDWTQMRMEVRHDDILLMMMPRGYGPIMYIWTQLTAGDENDQHGRIAFETQDL